MRVEICHRVTGKALAQILDDRMKIMWNQLIITVVPLHPASQEVRAANCEVWPLTYAQHGAGYKHFKLMSPSPLSSSTYPVIGAKWGCMCWLIGSKSGSAETASVATFRRALSTPSSVGRGRLSLHYIMQSGIHCTLSPT